jgi:hypothetical protein
VTEDILGGEVDGCPTHPFWIFWCSMFACLVIPSILESSHVVVHDISNQQLQNEKSTEWFVAPVGCAGLPETHRHHLIHIFQEICHQSIYIHLHPFTSIYINLQGLHPPKTTDIHLDPFTCTCSAISIGTSPL